MAALTESLQKTRCLRAPAAPDRSTERWRAWEFWPAWLFYIPVGANYLRLALKYRGFTLPTASNPGIFSGGFVGESKIATLRDLHTTSPEFTAPHPGWNGFTASASWAKICAWRYDGTAIPE